MPFIEVTVNGRTISRHESIFANKKLEKEVADSIRGKDRKAHTLSSRDRRKKKS